MEFRILGPLEVVERGRALALGGSRQRALLALLLTRANEVVSTDRLIDELWGNAAPKTAVERAPVPRLPAPQGARPERGDRHPGAGLPDPRRPGRARPAPLRAAGRGGAAGRRPRLAARLLREALALWRGPALADLAHESFAQRRSFVSRSCGSSRSSGGSTPTSRSGATPSSSQSSRRSSASIRSASGSARSSCSRSTARDGRPRRSSVYRETRRLLVDELGIEPSPALQELEQAILRQDPELDPAGSMPQPPRQRAIMVVAGDASRLDDLLAIAEPLARRPARELILARLLSDDGDLAAANAELAERRHALAERGVVVPRRRLHHVRAGNRRRATRHASTTSISSSSTHRRRSSRAAVPTRISTSFSSSAPCDVAVLAGSGRARGRADRHAVRRRRARLVRDRGRRVACRSRSGRRSGSSEPRPTPRSAGAMPAGCWRAPRCSFSRSSESSPSRFSFAPARKASSKPRMTRGCSSSVCRTAGATEGIGRVAPRRCGARERADALRPTRPPAERRRAERDADALHVDARIAAGRHASVTSPNRTGERLEQ